MCLKDFEASKIFVPFFFAIMPKKLLHGISCRGGGGGGGGGGGIWDLFFFS